MKPEDLKNGRRYRLTKNVENPSLDKRERYDCAKLAWLEEAVFRCERWDQKPEPEEASLPEVAQMRPMRYVGKEHDGFAALVEALEELPERSHDVIERVCAGWAHAADEVLEKLVTTGRISLADVEAAAECVREENET